MGYQEETAILDRQVMPVIHEYDAVVARRSARELACKLGFDEKAIEEIAIVTAELASNLFKHAVDGAMVLEPIKNGMSTGIQIETRDAGPGIRDTDSALADGFSTAGSLGYGLGTVNRLMDEFEIFSDVGSQSGTKVVARRWLKCRQDTSLPCPLDFGAAARPHPHMKENGDAFVIKTFSNGGLAAVIDGLGHGQFAHRASRAASQYVEDHFDLPLPGIFRGVSRACRSTRGVVMALARIDLENSSVSVAGLGNVEARLSLGGKHANFLSRRGVVGMSTNNPVITQHAWGPSALLVLHSDGLRTHWHWDEFASAWDKPATLIAGELLRKLARDNDDAAVVVVKNKGQNPRGE